MAERIPVRTLLDAPHGEAPPPIRRVLNGLLKRRVPSIEPQAPRVYWNAGHFGLHRSALFQEASRDDQEKMLAACSRNLLAESYFIEKAGLAFCAKMVLLAETTEERQLYSLIGADEATHLAWVSAYVDSQIRTAPPDPFTGFIAQLVESGERNSLTYILQVILEGWGIAHYRSLAADCLDPDLRDMFSRIVHDEGLHHAGGLALFEPRAVDTRQRRFILEALADFLSMVRTGPRGVVRAIEQSRGELSQREQARTFAELEIEQATLRKLDRLKSLIAQPGMHWVIEMLDDKKLFTPCTPAQCAKADR